MSMCSPVHSLFSSLWDSNVHFSTKREIFSSLTNPLFFNFSMTFRAPRPCISLSLFFYRTSPTERMRPSRSMTRMPGRTYSGCHKKRNFTTPTSPECMTLRFAPVSALSALPLPPLPIPFALLMLLLLPFSLSAEVSFFVVIVSLLLPVLSFLSPSATSASAGSERSTVTRKILTDCRTCGKKTAYNRGL